MIRFASKMAALTILICTVGLLVVLMAFTPYDNTATVVLLCIAAISAFYVFIWNEEK